jgi:hypothetical protein
LTNSIDTKSIASQIGGQRSKLYKTGQIETRGSEQRAIHLDTIRSFAIYSRDMPNMMLNKTGTLILHITISIIKFFWSNGPHAEILILKIHSIPNSLD